MKLCLGTVQFGLDYGIANRAGQAQEEEVRKILEEAAAFGVTLLDTAPFYGDCEDVLGRVLPRDHTFSIVSKVAEQAEVISAEAIKTIVETAKRTLRRLRIECLEGLKLHHSADLFKVGGAELYDALTGLQRAGLVKKLGISVYSPEEVNRVLASFTIDLVQFPANIFDQRWTAGDLLSGWRAKGLTLFVRSVFLQGLLLLDSQELPPAFESVRPLLADLHNDAWEHGLTPAQICLAYIQGISEIDYAILGVNDAQQFGNNLRDFAKADSTADLDFSRYAVSNVKVINPSLWSRA